MIQAEWHLKACWNFCLVWVSQKNKTSCQHLSKANGIVVIAQDKKQSKAIKENFKRGTLIVGGIKKA